MESIRVSLSTNGNAPNTNGSIEIERVFAVSDAEQAIVAEVAGSLAARQMVRLLRSAEAATENTEPETTPAK
jgi:hypothetical protein